MATPVVDFERIKRLQLPEETGGPSTMTKVYMVVIVLSLILLVKRYKDIRKRPRLSGTF
jgi:hypothetical protein